MNRNITFWLLMTIASATRAQEYDWALTSVDTSEDRAWDVAYDGFNNVYMGGSFRGTMDIQGTILTGSDTGASELVDAYLAKFDAAGNILWALSFPGTNNSTVRALAVDRLTDDVYITGDFYSSLTIGTFNLTNAGFTGGFIAKVNSAGVPVWAYSIDGVGGGCFTESIAIENNGNTIYIGGYNFAPGGMINVNSSLPVVNKGPCDAFIAKYSKSGACKWVRTATGYNTSVSSLCVDNSGNVYAAGNISNPTQWEGSVSVLTPAGSSDMYLVKYGKLGVFKSIQQIGGTGFDFDPEIDADDNSNIYVSGMYESSITLGTFTLNAASFYSEIFLAKLNKNGVYKWAKRIYAQGNVADVHMNCDESGDTYLTGKFDDTLYFGNKKLKNLNAGTFKEVFIIKYGYAGAAQWGKLAYGDGVYVSPMGIDAKSEDLVAICGYSPGNMHFDAITLNHSGDDDLYLAQVKLCPDLIFSIDVDTTEFCIDDTIVATLPDYPGYFYNWYINGFVVFWDTDINTLDIITGGEYTCVITSPVGCVYYSDTIFMTQFACREMQDNFIGQHTVTIAPNPASDHITIHSDETFEPAELILTDISGKVVYENNNCKSDMDIDISMLENGIYLLQIKNGGKIICTEKIVIQK